MIAKHEDGSGAYSYCRGCGVTIGEYHHDDCYLDCVIDEQGKQRILDTYLKLTNGLLGEHPLWVAIERIANGEREDVVMMDYGYRYQRKDMGSLYP